MRIVVGPVEVSGVGRSLVKAFRELGEQADLVLSVSHPFQYGAGDEDSGLLFSLWRKIGDARLGCARSRFIKKTFFVLMHKLFGWTCFFWLLLRSDVFLFTYGSTFTDTWLELYILKLLNKKIFFVYFGSEARPPFMDGAITPLDLDNQSLSYLLGLSKKCRNKVRLHEKFSNFIINSPASGHYHSRPFINWFSVGLPVADFAPDQKRVVRNHKAVRILHSPSNPNVKGSFWIERAISSLIAKGYVIDFVKLSGVSNAVILEELANCDFVVDQVFSDTPMAVFAAEAAKFGKPSIVAGYFSEFIKDYVGEGDIPPVVFVLPEYLEPSIERLIVDCNYRAKLGREAEVFLNERWAGLAVAKRYISIFKGCFPSEWLVDPYSISYIYGGGVSKEKLKNTLTAYVGKFGIEALGFSDKPGLEIEIMKFISVTEK